MKSVVKYMLFSGLFLLTLDMCVGMNIRGVSAKVIKIKREADPKLKGDSKAEAEFFPDWVPFKKNIEELGELVPVKQKPKKRLALPVNFVLKAAGDDSDDIFYKGEGETDADEDFEKKEWSDTHRPPAESKEEPTPIEEADILTKDSKPSDHEKIIRDEIREDDKSLENIYNNNATNIGEEENYKRNNSQLEKDVSNKKPPVKGDTEYDEESAEEKAKKEEEKIKKEKIIREVDELIKKHTEEQRLISEKVKEDNDNSFVPESEENYNKYDNRIKEKPKEYDDYDDVADINDKYPILTSAKPSTESDSSPLDRHRPYNRPFDKETFDFTPDIEKERKPDITDIDKRKIDIYGHTTDVDGHEPNERKTIQYEMENPSGLTEKYTNTFVPSSTLRNGNDENVRISLVPKGDEAHNEPTTFYVKKSKKHRRKKVKTTTAPPDTSVAETIEDKTSTQASINDAIPASSEHKKEGGGDFSHESGNIYNYD